MRHGQAALNDRDARADECGTGRQVLLSRNAGGMQSYNERGLRTQCNRLTARLLDRQQLQADGAQAWPVKACVGRSP